MIKSAPLYIAWRRRPRRGPDPCPGNKFNALRRRRALAPPLSPRRLRPASRRRTRRRLSSRPRSTPDLRTLASARRPRLRRGRKRQSQRGGTRAHSLEPSSAAAAPVETDIETRKAQTAPKRAPLDGDLIRRRWRSLIGRHPPKTLSHVLMDRILAWREQVAEGGDISSRSRAILAAALAGKTTGAEKDGQVQDNENEQDHEHASPRPRAPLRVGTALIREHAGVLHRVTVVAEGFEWDGRIYASLSAVARAITGVRWNGRRFFALDRGATQVVARNASERDAGARRASRANPPAPEATHDRVRSLRHLHSRLHRRGS